MLNQSSQAQKSTYVLFHLPEVQEEASMIYSDRRKIKVITVAGGGGGWMQEERSIRKKYEQTSWVLNTKILYILIKSW